MALGSGRHLSGINVEDPHALAPIQLEGVAIDHPGDVDARPLDRVIARSRNRQFRERPKQAAHEHQNEDSRQIAVSAVLGAGFAGSLFVTFFPDTRLGSIGILLAAAGIMLLPKVGKPVAGNEATVAADVPRPNWLFRALVFFGPLAVAWFGATALSGESSLFGPFLVAGFAFCAYSTFRPAQF